VPLSKTDIRRLFELLDEELSSAGVIGEIYVVGGAVMCLVHAARPATRDVDALLLPAKPLREAARRVAARADLPETWLNDAAKGYLSELGDYDAYLELGHLRVLTAQPAYLLAMKCLAARIGEEFHDLDDIRYLLRHLDIASYDDALAVICRYYPEASFPQKTFYLLEELLPRASG
jgi:hypothetical protein